MNVLERLEPKRVFAIFEELSAIPRGSGNARAAGEYCLERARAMGLSCGSDAAGNVWIVKEASAGYETAPAVLLQGHLDMVCEKTADCTKDFSCEGIDLYTDGEFVRARGTTLGADDGIGVALALAAAQDDTLAHPRLELLFTVDEEIGMLGAAALDPTMLTARRLINLDSEDEGVFTVGCAGGSITRCALPINRAPFAGETLAVAVSGLVGGHSGVEIHRGRANANVLLGRLLRAAETACELRLVSAEGGKKTNAIPVSARAEIVVSDADAARRAIQSEAEKLRREYDGIEGALAVDIEDAPCASLPMDAPSTCVCIALLSSLPNGVQAMDPNIAGLVRTSLNLGILTCEEREFACSFCVRSGVDAERVALQQRLRRVTEDLGGSVRVSGEYGAWEYRENSPLRATMEAVFCEQYGVPPRVETIHAGVECGVLCGKMPGLDCVSIGPDIADIHTPSERLSVASVRRLWQFLRETLRRLK